MNFICISNHSIFIDLKQQPSTCSQLAIQAGFRGKALFTEGLAGLTCVCSQLMIRGLTHVWQLARLMKVPGLQVCHHLASQSGLLHMVVVAEFPRASRKIKHYSWVFPRLTFSHVIGQSKSHVSAPSQYDGNSSRLCTQRGKLLWLLFKVRKGN